MKKIISTEKLPIKLWLDDIEDGALQQAKNIAHNYVSQEKHFGRKVYVNRKGATSARKNELGIIPGSQGTCSYIVRGKGNKDSFKGYK